MKTTIRALAVPLLLLTSGIFATACGSASPAGDPQNADDFDQTPDADQDLAALDIGSDELIADETEDEAIDPSAWPQANPYLDETDDLEDDAGDYSQVPDVLPDPPSELPFRPFSTAILTNHVESLSFSCPENPLHSSCVCRGSLYNCQFPNPQPGRNRYLPPAAIDALNAAQGASENKRQEIIAKIGQWDLQSGAHLYDGAGVDRGEVFSECYDANLERAEPGHPCVKIDFGQVKRMTPVGEATKSLFVYAFSVSAGGVGASGWVKRNAITNASFKAYDTPPRSASNFAVTSYVLKSAEDYGAQVATFNPGQSLPSWAGLKVGPGVPATVDETAGDYLLRAHGVLNLAYQTPLLGGAADDTFVVRHDAIAFKRVRSIDPNHKAIVKTLLYPTAIDKAHPGTKSNGHMYFLFGEVEGRFGWVAEAAIKKGSPSVATGIDSCTGKADGVYCSVTTGAYICSGGSIAGGLYCADRSQSCTGPNGPGAAIQCQ